MSGATVDGACEDAFAGVRAAFAENFESRGEIGAAVCVYVGDRCVVDLWGGEADPKRGLPWTRDTLVNAYSTGKGLVAMLALDAAERGLLDYDTKVASVWPEFGVAGKEDTTIRMLLAHQAGLPSVRERLPELAMYDWDGMCAALAGQSPWWKPGEAHGYHVGTFGYLVGEVLQRLTGQTMSTLLQERIMGPLGVDYYWSLPRALHDRVAPIQVATAEMILDTPELWARAFPATGDAEHDTMVWHTYFNPCGLSGMGTVNTAAWREAVIPSTNGHGNARALAAAYRRLAGVGSAKPLVSPALLAEACRIHSDGEDRILGRPSRFGLGFQLTSPGRPLGPNPDAFGHYGYGGSLGFVDAVAGVAFGFVTNLPGDRWQTPRTQALIDVVYASL